MGFLNILQLILITLKLFHFINWSWWYVLAPCLFQIIFSLLTIALAIYAAEKKKGKYL